DDVLPALLTCHSHDQAMFLLAARKRLVPPDYEVVEQHGANHSKNHAEIELADPTYCDAAHISRQGLIHMYPAKGEFFGHAGMAPSARVHKVSAVDGGAWIARGQDIVNSVATGAIGHDLGSQPRSQPMIARQVGAGSMPLDAEFLGEPHTLMAPGASHTREVRRRDRRIWINMSFDGMDTVAIGADWCRSVAPRDRLAVDTLGEFLLHLGMALRTGGGHVEFEDR